MKFVIAIAVLMLATTAYAQTSASVADIHKMMSPELQSLAQCSDESWQLIIQVQDALALGEKLPFVTTHEHEAQLRLIGDCKIRAGLTRENNVDNAITVARMPGVRPDSIVKLIVNVSKLSAVVDIANMTETEVQRSFWVANYDALIEDYNTVVKRYSRVK